MNETMETNEGQKEEIIPFAEKMRQKQAAISPDNTKALEATNPNDDGSEDVGDVDEEIRRLEAELAIDECSSSASSDSEEERHNEEQERDKCKVSFGPTVMSPEKSGVDKKRGRDFLSEKLCLSQVAKERIKALPLSALPRNKRRKLKGIDYNELSQKSKLSNDKCDNKEKNSEENKPAVKQLLDAYVARSSRVLPFYCRICSMQSTNEEEFYAHRKSDSHHIAARSFQKATFCKACKKQLTSPVQMREHLASRPHKEKMQYLQSGNAIRQNRNERNGKFGRGCGRGLRRGRGLER